MDICGKINLMDDNIGIDIPLFLKFKDFILEINDGNIDTPRIISQKNFEYNLSTCSQQSK
jgi:hypothetical protein